MNDGLDDPDGTPGISRRQRIVVWLMLVRAVVVLLLGISLLTTGFGRPILGNLFAMYWLVGAIVTLAWGRANRGLAGSRLALVSGAVGVVAGLVAVTRLVLIQLISANTILAVLGVSAILMGLLRMTGALRDDPRLARRSVRRTILGGSEIVLGMVWVAADGITDTVTDAAGWWGVLGGTILLLDALVVRRTPELTLMPQPAP